ncbi:helix-turn-helix domain-containing protein [Streptomyces sp. NPDC005065]|uniref:helix-turn-helix domain-containing protein n=1 Tax=unclassified Streptomyces TaxID=2593676 RepID=UPI0033A21CDF
MEAMLEVLGIDPESESVYAALLSGRPVTLDDLVRTAGLPPARLRVALRRLQSSGLVGRRHGRPATYIAIDPEVALDGLLLNRQDELHKARLRAGEFTERFRRAAATRDPAEVIEIVTGTDAVQQRSDQMVRNVRHQLRVFDKPPYHDGGLDPNQAELDLLNRGVTVRAVYDAASIDIPGRQKLVRMWAEAGEEARILADVPTKMGLVDDRLAMLPLRAGSGPDPSPSFVVLHRSAVLDALSALFEALWAVAQPLRTQDAAGDDPQALSEREQLLVSLLTAGLPDEAIARQADLSYRTLQRRVRALMERAGASTRFQLGIHAAANGWVTGVKPRTSVSGGDE